MLAIMVAWYWLNYDFGIVYVFCTREQWRTLVFSLRQASLGQARVPQVAP